MKSLTKAFAVLVRLASALGVVLLVVGCGSEGPELIPVKGTLTLDGTPLASKNLYFSPEPGTPGLGAGGNTKPDGTFELLAVVGGAVKDMKGAPPGSYRVVVSEPMFPIETELEIQGVSAEPEVAIGLPQRDPRDRAAQQIPSLYGNKDSTPLRVQIGPDPAGDVKLELVSQR